MDIECSEWSAFDAILASSWCLSNVKQLMVEFHPCQVTTETKSVNQLLSYWWTLPVPTRALYTVEPRKLWSYWTEPHQVSTRCRRIVAAVKAPIGTAILQSVSERQGDECRWRVPIFVEYTGRDSCCTLMILVISGFTGPKLTTFFPPFVGRLLVRYLLANSTQNRPAGIQAVTWDEMRLDHIRVDQLGFKLWKVWNNHVCRFRSRRLKLVEFFGCFNACYLNIKYLLVQ